MCHLKSKASPRSAYTNAKAAAVLRPLTPCARVRKSWNDYTDSEKQLYNRALDLAWKAGAQQLFADMHNYLYNTEIHNSCAFLFCRLAIQSYLLPTETPPPSLTVVSHNIEWNVHGMVHNILGGDMLQPFSPHDPIFFSHHATIDALGSIYHTCRAANLPSTDDRVFPSSCPASQRDASGNPGFTITRETDIWDMETAIVNARIDPAMAPWFLGLPAKYSYGH